VAREEEALERGSDFVGQNPQTKALLGTASQISQTDTRLLLNGEVGTGKEVLARRVHFQSHRRRGPFVSINCSAYASGLIERALFGVDGGEHEEETPGLLEQADGGTLFIRHVDHLSLTAQFELLRAIEEGVMYRLGSSIPRPINFRTIASTTNDLWGMVKAGEFREDLCQRLSEMVLTLPPLREVRDDIGGLARHFLSMAARQMGVPMPELDPAAEDCLLSYPWPGNVSELKNMMDRLVIFAAGERIVLDDLSPDIRYAPGAFRSYNGEPESDTMAEVERILIRRALARSNGDFSIAADILSISESDLEECIHRYEITLD
jgi:DNA-binding NtrC family response regulator